MSVAQTGVAESRGPTGFLGGAEFVGRVVSARSRRGFFKHVLDVDGFMVTPMDDVEHRVDTVLRVRGRLDLDEVESVQGAGWRAV